MINILIGIVLGTIIGSIVTLIYKNTHVVGNLIIDRSDPDDKPYIFLQISRELAYVSQKNVISVKVKNKNFVTQK